MKKRLSMPLVCLFCVTLLISALAEGGLELSIDALGPEAWEDMPAPDDTVDADPELSETEIELNLDGIGLESAEPASETGFPAPNETATGDIPIDAAHFPDGNFRKALNYYDKNGDGVLSEEERDVTYMSVYQNGIADLTGIEYFPNVTSLTCSYNPITALDLTKNTALTGVSCECCDLTALNVKGCNALRSLQCEYNDLQSLDVSGCPALEMLYCDNNSLSALDVTANPVLWRLYCTENQMTSLRVKGLRNLREVYCRGNLLTSLDFTDCWRMEKLECDRNQLTSLKISDCDSLVQLDCRDNQLTALELGGLNDLMDLKCQGNRIVSIDLTKCASLRLCAANEPWIDQNNVAHFEYYDGNTQVAVMTIDASTAIIIDGKAVYGKLPESLAKAKVTARAQVYSGKAKKPAVTVTLNGKTLSEGTDYTVNYSNNVKIGKAAVTVVGTGDYKGTAKGSFVINPKAVSKLTLKAGKNQLAASWKKGVGGVGYELQYGLKKSFAGAKKAKISKTATVRRTLKGLKAGKTYYIRIRAWKKVGGKTYYSAWSGAKSAKVQ